MTFSIIIPTINKCDQLLKPCIDSILQYTTVNTHNTEIIVVANGCTDNTADYIHSLQKLYHNIVLLENAEPMGYTKAVNWGIENARGEFLVLLNNDTILLNQQYNDWLNILHKPFEDPSVGLTGPMKVVSESCGREFLIFFCVMIKREVFEKVGMLDEIFSPGYGEDTDLCLRAEEAGYKVLQVPSPSSDYYAEKRMAGNFPIYHAGNETFKDYPDAELIHTNNRILAERYKKPSVDISKAQTCDGYMSDVELLWLAEQARKSNVFIEIGSWHGRSSRAIADNLPPEGVLYCVDHWMGSQAELVYNHASAALNEGDHAFMEFSDNLVDHIKTGKVIPIRMSSKNAASFFKKHNILADTIFIDAGHTYKEVIEDIDLWLPLVKPGGDLCGHDYYHDGTNIWPEVRQAVDQKFGHKGTNMGYINDNSIWRHTIEKVKEVHTPVVIDCFPFNNELDVLEERLKTLYDHVDRFVIIEAMETHSGKPKELVFNANLDRFARYLNKVTYGVVERFPQVEGSITDKSWARERYQRDFIMNYLTKCQDDDIIIISDCDEIPSVSAIERMRQSSVDYYSLEMDLYYYNRGTKAKDKWLEGKISRYRFLKTVGPCGLRYAPPVNILKDAGEHLSYFGGVEAVINKIENTAHQEYNTPEMKDPNRIKEAIENGSDVFGRDYVQFEKL